jgi:hypothetical protein
MFANNIWRGNDAGRSQFDCEARADAARQSSRLLKIGSDAVVSFD